MSSLRKRKGHQDYLSTTHPPREGDGGDDDAFYQSLSIQAHEADIVRGPHAKTAAISLEVADPGGVFPADHSLPSSRFGEGLIKWTAASHPPQPVDQDGGEESRTGGIWVDRYDARLLLDDIPVISMADTFKGGSESPGGWSDLPSDSEDTFFFSPEEADDYHRDKRRRYLEKVREERLQARQAEDGEATAEAWGGSDEEPDKTQRELMQRTAIHISTSSNPSQLEMRILANHGNDERFAFLRGRWKRAWNTLKRDAHDQGQNSTRTSSAVGLGALVSYADSTDESSEDESSIKREVGVSNADNSINETAKEARRARAKEWAASRRALKNDSQR